MLTRGACKELHTENLHNLVVAAVVSEVPRRPAPLGWSVSVSYMVRYGQYVISCVDAGIGGNEEDGHGVFSVTKQVSGIG